MPIDEANQTWADTADVLTLTGETVTTAQVIQAQEIIELFCGTTFLATDNLSGRNLRFLGRAVAYQAAWMLSRPDLFSHLDVQTISQDGASFTPASENAQLLAPFTIRCLRRLSWADKPLRVRRGYNQSEYSDNGPRDSAVADDNRIWTPM